MSKRGKAKFSKEKVLNFLEKVLGLQVKRITVDGKRVWEVSNGKLFNRYFKNFAEIVNTYKEMMKRSENES